MRSESVQGQLDGSIPSTQEGQKEDGATVVDTGDLNLSDMGTMNNAMGENMGGNEAVRTGNFTPDQLPESTNNATNAALEQPGSEAGAVSGAATEEEDGRDIWPQRGFDMGGVASQDSGGETSVYQIGVIILMGVSILTLLTGLLIAFKFKR